MRKEEKLKAKGKRKDIPGECRVPRKARRHKKAFLSDQCKEIEEINKMRKTRDHFKKTRDTKGIVHVLMDSIKQMVWT